MLSFIKSLMYNNPGSPSSARWVMIISAISLNVGFLSCTAALLFGASVPESIILGLGGILATLAGVTYGTNKVTGSPKDKVEE